jgi:hypothetical protein
MTDRDSQGIRGGASRRTTPSRSHNGDAPRVVEGRDDKASPSPGESKYPAPARPEPITGPGGLRIEVPQDAPVITPGAARALLRLILAAAQRQQVTTEPPEPSRRTS